MVSFSQATEKLVTFFPSDKSFFFFEKKSQIKKRGLEQSIFFHVKNIEYDSRMLALSERQTFSYERFFGATFKVRESLPAS